MDVIVDTILAAHPDAQAIYLYGSHATGEARPDSDVDLALLLPPARARRVGRLTMSELTTRLAELTTADVELVNLRLANTVLQNEVVSHGRRIHCRDEAACDAFEMLTLSFYQRLNMERSQILDALRETKRAYPV